MFWRVMPCKTRCQAMGFFRFEGFIPCPRPMRGHVVNHQHDAFSLRVIFIRPQAQLFGNIALGTSLGDPHVTPTP